MTSLKLESEEYQTLLRVVLKSEIQFLLERLSKTGEETVVLTADTGKSCTGHLASPNAERFVDLDDIGKLKNKFLFFLKGASKAIARPDIKIPPAVTTGSRVNKPGSNQPVSSTSSDMDTGAASDVVKHQDGRTSTPNQIGAKRPLDCTSGVQTPVAGPVTKARKLETEKPTAGVLMSASPGPRPRPGQVQPTTSEGPKAVMAGLAEVKLGSTRVVSRSGGFTEERLSDAEFKKILQHVNNGESDEEEIDEEEYSDEDYDGGHLEEGEINFNHPNFIKMNTFQGAGQQGQNVNTSVVKTNSSVVGKIKTPVSSVGQAGDVMADSDDCMSALDWTSNGSKADGGPGRRLNPATGSKDSRIGDTGVRINPIQIPEILEEVDPHDLAYRKSLEKIRVGAAAVKDSGEVAVRTEPDKKTAPSSTTPNKAGQSQPRTDRFPITDDMDTETLIKMTKASRKENMSEADQAIEAKLGQLSSKLSWVVEYPKDSGQSGQTYPQSQQQQMMNQGDNAQYMEGEGEEDEEEEDEEDYEEFDEDDLDNIDEEGLDEEDKAALRKRRAELLLQQQKMLGLYNQEMGGLGTGYHLNVAGEYEDAEEEEEDYNDEELEEMEEGGFDEFGEYMGADGSELHGANMATPLQMGQQGLGQGPYMGPSGDMGSMQVQADNFMEPPLSPSFENFLLVGPVLAKCLVCNKIVRKTEVKQHNQSHVDEMNEAEGLEGEDAEDIEEGGVGGEEQEHEETYEEYEETEGDGSGESEFVAEKFVAEKVAVPSKVETEKPSKKNASLVCEVCNKTFKTVAYLTKHKKIHDKCEETLCPVCQKSFRLYAYMVKHLRKIHPDYKDADGDVKKKKGSTCNVCKQTFSDKDSLSEHMQTHA